MESSSRSGYGVRSSRNAASATTNGSVSRANTANSIPSAALQNVEVITGGAAAVYGADAIAGVVNFILKDNFEGLQFDAQAGVSEHGDAEQFQVSALVGGNFAEDRGNVMLGVVWSDRQPGYQSNRQFYTNAWNDPATPGGRNGVPITHAVVGNIQYGINPDGSLFNSSNAVAPSAPYTGPLNDLENGAGFKLTPDTGGPRTLGFNYPDSYNTIPLTRYSLFGSANYDITDSINFFLEGNFVHSKAVVQGVAGTMGTTWAVNVPYNPANDDPDSPTFGANQSRFYPVSRQLADVLNARPNPSADWRLHRGTNFLGRILTESSSQIYQITAGLRGDVGIKDWNWNIYGSHGSTTVVAQQPVGPISRANFQQVLSGLNSAGVRSPTINGPWSAGWTSGATFNPNSCASGIQIFDANGQVAAPQQTSADTLAVSDDCLRFVTLELNNVTKLTQQIVEGTVEGALFDNWAGEVRFAAGGTYRKNDFTFNPDTGNSSEQADINLIGVIALPGPTAGGITAKEAFGELLIPVLRDLPLVQSFDLEVGARYAKYDRSGSVVTFKALGDWQVNDWLRLRGGFQRANRAPNVYEMFAPVAGGLGTTNDPCVNIAGFTPAYGNVDGNPNRLNLQQACQALMARDGAFDYRTLTEDPAAVSQAPTLYPAGLDLTRMSNFRWTTNYNQAQPASISISRGNPDLDSEKADTITIGGVIRSPFASDALRRLTITADYYSIKLEDTIGQPSGVEIYSQCLDPAFNPLMASAPGTNTGEQLLAGSPFCSLARRYPLGEDGTRGTIGSGGDRTYDAPFLNKGTLQTAGIDLAVDWATDFDDLGIGIPGGLALSVSGNILLEYKSASLPGAALVDLKGTVENLAFDYKVFGSLSYQWDDGGIGVRGRHLPSIAASPFAAKGTQGADAYTEFALFANYSLSDTIQLRGGVDNVLNTQPRVSGATPVNANRGITLPVYDTIGRSFYVGARVRF